MNRRDALILGATSLVVSAVPARAQSSAGARKALKMKMTTNIPASITTPDKVETRIGTLKFFDGFPDKATVEKVYDNLDFQRGVQAYLTALPAVSIEGARRGAAGFGPANQTVSISEDLLDSKSLFLTANTTTPYTVLYLNTKDGPLVLEIPPEVLGPLDDAWFRWVTDVGLTGPDKGAGGKICCCLPATRARSPTATLLRIANLRKPAVLPNLPERTATRNRASIVSKRACECIRSVKPPTHLR